MITSIRTVDLRRVVASARPFLAACVAWLRAGDPPGAILERRSPERLPQARPALRRAAIARARGARARPYRGIALVPWSDAAYPAALAAISDPPPVLWARGNLAALTRPAVAIVGSRAGSPYGLSVAERLAADLAARGVVVVSGLARGVDSAAHRGALAADGSTMAVLGSGVDVDLSAGARGARAPTSRPRGAVLSELVPGTPPLPHFFPLRNRIISGLSRAVVVVEAGEKSGSLITARLRARAGTRRAGGAGQRAERP